MHQTYDDIDPLISYARTTKSAFLLFIIQPSHRSSAYNTCKSTQPTEPQTISLRSIAKETGTTFLSCGFSSNMAQDAKEEQETAKFIDEPVTEELSEMLLSDMKFIPRVEYSNYGFHLEFDRVPAEAEEVARNELRESPEVVEESLRELKVLLEQETNLVAPVHKRQWLIRFLRPCKYHADSAFELIQRYYKFKMKHPEIYEGLLPSKVTNVFKENIVVFQQERDQLGRRIVMVELGRKWKPQKVSLDDFLKGCVLLLELGMLEPQTQMCGIVAIFNMDGLSFTQATKFTPGFLKKLVDWLQECVPLRIKNIHVVNQSYIFNIILNMMKPFLREKLRSRLILHGADRKSLHKYLKPECLPQRYGGTLKLPNVKPEDWVELLSRCDQEYQAINRYGYKPNK